MLMVFPGLAGTLAWTYVFGRNKLAMANDFG